jgi:archaellum component FlaG (FlaF/FlaG flagellin family)
MRNFHSTQLILVALTILFGREGVSQVRSIIFPPKIEVVGGPTYDFGEIYRGEKVTHVFTIKNAGSDTLFIKNVTATCGCTAAIVSTSAVPPLGTTEVSVTFNSTGYSGKVGKAATVHTNDPTNPSQQLTIMTDIREVLRIDKAYVDFQQAKVDSTSSAVVQLKNATNKSLKILGVETKVGGLQLELERQNLKPGESTKLIAIFKPEKVGITYGEIVVKTDFKPSPMVSIPFAGNAHQ